MVAAVRRWYRLNGMGDCPVDAWVYRGIAVVSSVDRIHHDGPTWHLSVTEKGARPGRRAMALVRRDFGMTEAEEDNHAPGMTLRDLWMPVDPAQRNPCPCKETEEPVIEMAGQGDDAEPYIWRPGEHP